MLETFLINLKNNKIKTQMNFVNNYKKSHDCTLSTLYHDNGFIILDATNNLYLADIKVTH